MGLTKEELLPHGNYIAKVDYMKVLKRLEQKPDGKFIEVTAITPTPLGEGKSTTTMGLLQGIGKVWLFVSIGFVVALIAGQFSVILEYALWVLWSPMVSIWWRRRGCASTLAV